ncbi:MAG: tetratricopeptide repeat protein [Nitrospirota bacterium]
MNKIDPRLKEIQNEIENIRKILVRYGEMEIQNEGKTRKTKGEARIDELRARLAWLLLDAEEYHEGLIHYQKLPWGVYGEKKYIGISRALIELEEYSEAGKFLAKGLKRFPESGPLMVARGLLNRRIGDSYEALQDFRKAFELMPDDRHVIYDISLGLNDMGYSLEASNILRKLVKNYPDDPEYALELGHALTELGYPWDAVSYFRKTLKMGFESPAVYGGLSFAYMNLGMKNEALKVAEEGLRKFPEGHPGLYENLGELYRLMGWQAEAREILDKGLKIFPDDERLRKLLEDMDNDSPSDFNKRLRISTLLMFLISFLKKSLHKEKK